MHSALLANGKIITAKEYDEMIHGESLQCIDSTCHVPVFYVNANTTATAHFKTSGKGTSIHKESCGFAKKLTFKESVDKVGEYQSSLQQQGIREFVVKLNLNKLDPDYVPKTVERGTSEKEPKEPDELDSKALKEEKETPKSISSLKSVKKLFKELEPDILASIIISVNGMKLPISKIICHCEDAHKAVWNNEVLPVPYFVHGTVSKIHRREKVWYISLDAEDTPYFTLVIFEKYFRNFTYKDDELIGKEILAAGPLKKNDYNKERHATEMIIKSDKYIEFL